MDRACAEEIIFFFSLSDTKKKSARGKYEEERFSTAKKRERERERERETTTVE